MQSKIEAEKAVWNAADQCLSVSIARPGAIYSEHDRYLIPGLWWLLRLRIPLPQRIEAPFPAISAKVLARQLILQAISSQAHNQVFNAIDAQPQPLHVLAQELAQVCSLPKPRFLIPESLLQASASIAESLPWALYWHRFAAITVVNPLRLDTSKRTSLLDFAPPPQKSLWLDACRKWCQINR